MLPADQVKLVGLLAVSPFAGALMKRLKNPFVRRVYSSVLGFACLLVLFSISDVVMIVSWFLISYLLTVVAVRLDCPSIPTFVIVAVLSFYNIKVMMTKFLSWEINPNMVLMVFTAKCASLAYNVSDGEKLKKGASVGLNDFELPRVRKYAITSGVPSIWNYMSYALDFQSVLVGPAYRYVDYERFIADGNAAGNASSSGKLWKVVGEAVMCLMLYLPTILLPWFSATSVASWQRSAFVKLVGAAVIIACTRMKYYAVWKVSEACGIASGMSYDPSTKEHTLSSNCSVLGVELAPSMNDAATHWNTSISLWLRDYVYIRVTSPGDKLLKTLGLNTKSYATLVTRVVSAFWHGFYPGYYLFFVASFFLTQCDGTIKALCDSRWKGSRVYDLARRAFTFIMLNNLGTSFVLLSFSGSMKYMRSVYFVPYIILALFVIVIPNVVRTGPAIAKKNGVVPNGESGQDKGSIQASKSK